MSEQAAPINPLDAYRSRVQAFTDAMADEARRPYIFEIDVLDLMGMRGEVQPTISEDWRDFPRDPNDPNYLSPNMTIVQHGYEFPDLDLWLDNEGEFEHATQNLLGRLAQHTVPAEADKNRVDRPAWLVDELKEPLKAAVDGLREPVRTVAINCLYLDFTPEHVARATGTPVEAVDFLIQVALDQLAIVVRR